MIYYFNIILVFFKLFLTQFIYYIENTSYVDTLYMLLFLLILIKIITYIKNLPSRKLLIDHIMWYRFDYDIERYYSLFIVLFSLFFYVGTIIYLRIYSINKTINLIESKQFILNIIHMLPVLILLTIFCILILGFYLVFILIVSCIRKYINIELVKLHIYYLDKPLYEKIHNKFRFTFSAYAGFFDFLYSSYRYCLEIWALGYCVNCKNQPFRFRTKEEDALIHNTWLWKFFEPIYIKYFVDYLHFIILLSFLFYDIKFNQCTIQYTFKILPYLFVYQLYIMASKFVVEKPLNDVCSDVNIHFYHSIVYLGGKFALIDGELTEPPFNWIERFLEYERSGFTKSC